MPRRDSIRDFERIIREIFKLWGKKKAGRRQPGSRSQSFDPRSLLVLVGIGLIVIVAFVVSNWSQGPILIPGSGTSNSTDGVLFVSWNVENFFDDRDDPANHDDDEDWFGTNPEAFDRKVGALTDAVLLYNSGRGPDVLAMVEVESRRCVEALRDRLNERLPVQFRYTGIVQRDDRTGRRFAPAILTRLAVREDLTRGPSDFDNRRILEGHLESNGVPLIVIESHWTSRLRGEEATQGKRQAYAKKLYERYQKLRQETPGIDVILAGDFNDESDDSSLVDGLHTIAEPATSQFAESEPGLLDLVSAPKWRGQGTYQMNRRWEFLDHIIAPPELLDATGWIIHPDTLEIGAFRELRRGPDGPPWKFGGPKQTSPRGYSDHFALSVRLVLANQPE